MRRWCSPCLLLALLGSPAAAQELEPALRYPDAEAWVVALADAVPGLQACLDAQGAPGQAVSWTLSVAPSGATSVLAPSAEGSLLACQREALQALTLPPHDEEATEVEVVFAVRAGQVQPPLTVSLRLPQPGPLFLKLSLGAEQDDRRAVQEELDRWLGGGRPGPTVDEPLVHSPGG